jgi:hypothetical protein
MPKRSKKSDEEQMIFSLTYCSRANPNLRSADIESIISAARVKNPREEITGWLVWGSGIFFQWLEGKRENVKRLMASIMTDTRHDTIVILNESEEVRERLFGDWDMELVSADDIREVLVDAISEATDTKSLDALRTLLKEVDSSGLKPGLINNLIDL